MKIFQTRCVTLLFASLIALTGCAMFGPASRHQASSLVHYLYPKGMNHPDRPTVPTLSLPLRVGVAWVPEQRHVNEPLHSSEFSERQRMELLDKIIPQFKSYAFVKSIEIIPSAYLAPGGGFANVDQLYAMFDIDVIALVSYDQVQFVDEGLFSIAYWTVIGAWIVEGEKNDTQTMIDTAVYDIASRKLLFRAPGASRVKASATPINLHQELRTNSGRGFEQASTNMVANLQQQLARFQERVKESPEEFKIVRKPGYAGAGAAGMVEVLATVALTMLLLFRNKLMSV
jgi:rhombotail lipoprotein